MELLTKSREELLEYAGKLKLEFPKNVTDDKLRSMIETEAIRQSVELEEKVRLRLQEQSRTDRDLAEIRAEADSRGIKITIPEKPTLDDVMKLKKRLNLMIKEPKPSPETLAIEASKKVYAIFHNREQEDMDVTFSPGGKHWFHLWPEKVHIIPEWLIGYCRRVCRYPVYGKVTVPNPQGVKVGATIEKSGHVGWKQRFLFSDVVPAPDNASFGVVLDEKILSKFEQPE